MFRILESQAPAKQTAADTITILSGRLQSATLIEDRRAAILGLRSFAKLYPASVASGALRSLINSFGKDAEDVDTAKGLLETLLMLFNPDKSSPEASDDIALWLADEFTQRQENITILLDLLDRHDFFSRLYSLQLISAISTARPERTQECVYAAPLGVSRLVAVLDDKREAIRTEGLLLLTALTTNSPDLQKLVAFENTFDRIFSIIDAEGSLTHGGVVVQDCLSLLANLLRLNASNQSFFRETGWVARLAKILSQVVREESSGGVAEWVIAQRDMNVWGLLSVVRLFLVGGIAGAQLNQTAFWQNGVVSQILEIAFLTSMRVNVRSEALTTCADLIRGNGSLQEQFAQLEVASEALAPQTNGHGHTAQVQRVNVIQALLDLALSSSINYSFDVRLSACECIKAYLFQHAPIRLHFLRRAIELHLYDRDDVDNILSILLQSSEKTRPTDPYRQWLASIILFHLLHEDYDAKNLAMEIAEGDAANGEEVVTCIQSLSGNLIAGAQRGEDNRISIGYLIVLSGWLYEDPDAVNDFLGEGSSVQSLIQMVIQPNQRTVLLAGLCAFLLGIIYEFSTKDSPISRLTLHDIFTTHLGREQFIDKLTKLREHSLIRDFDVLPRGLSPDYPALGNLPEVYFDRTFVDFFKDNYSRILRAIDRDPGIEVSVIANGIQKGISRELVDSLKSQLEDRTQVLQKAEAEIITLERKLSQERADHRNAMKTASAEVMRVRNINKDLQRNHEEEHVKLQEEHQASRLDEMQKNEALVASLRARLQQSKEDNEATLTRIRARTEAEVTDLKSTIRKLEIELEKSNTDHMQDLHTAHEEYSSSLQAIQLRLKQAEGKAEEAEVRVTQARKSLEEKEEARLSAQTELDDMFMVLGDLEEKRERDKKRLKSLGEQVSDAEDEVDQTLANENTTN